MNQKKDDTIEELNTFIELKKKKFTKNNQFLNNLEKYAEDLLQEHEIVKIAKLKYLYDHKDAIHKAKLYGYSYKIIANFTTKELLQSNIPRKHQIITRDQEVIEKETMFSASEIKKFLEED